MLAINHQDNSQADRIYLHLSLQERINRRHRSIARSRRTLTNISEVFKHQAVMLPLQCSAAVEHLDALRSTAHSMQMFLRTLDPETTQRLKPWASIEKLVVLDYQLTEAILTIAMFEPVCLSVSFERVEIHLFIRSLFPRMLATFEDLLSQLAALVEKAQLQEGAAL